MKYSLLVYILLFTGTIFAQGEWKLEKNEDGIQVYLADTPESKYKTFKATTTINSDIEAVYAMLKDLKALTDYYHGIHAVTDITQVNESEASYFLEFEFPWPVTKRRAFVKSKAYPVEVGAYEIETSAIPSDSTKDGYVAVTNMSSIWSIVSAGENKTVVTTIAHMDPAGKIPGWIANAFVVDTPFKSLKKLKEILEN